MNKRERMLAGAVLVLVVAFGGVSLFKSYSTSINSGQSKLDDAQKRLAEANRALALGRRAAHKIADLKARSLPSDRDKALSLYKAWLLAKASSAGLKVNDIKLAPRTTPSTAFDAIGYSIDATGSLSSVISMLYEFYRSPQLQQITRLRLRGRPVRPNSMLALEVEALCLPGAVATDALPEGDAKRLKLASVAEYQKSLGERDMATVYTPPRPPAPPTVRRETPPPAAPPKFDESELARFSGTINMRRRLASLDPRPLNRRNAAPHGRRHGESRRARRHDRIGRRPFAGAQNRRQEVSCRARRIAPQRQRVGCRRQREAGAAEPNRRKAKRRTDNPVRYIHTAQARRPRGLLHADERHPRLKARVPKCFRPRHAPDAERFDRSLAEHKIARFVPSLTGLYDCFNRIEAIERHALQFAAERVLDDDPAIREPILPAPRIPNTR